VEKPGFSTYISRYKEPTMKHLLAAAACIGLLASAAQAQPPACKGEAAEKGGQTPRKKSARKPRTAPPGGGITPADKESLRRAMQRNILQSIEGELRRRRIGN
jgi:hypothetical protein